MRIVILGPPGSGKGTQAVRLAQAFGMPHVSTGDMMRAAITAGSSIGQKVKGYLDSGALVPDEVVIDLMRERLAQRDCGRGFLLDGFPRTVEQAAKLEELLTETGARLTHVINLSVPQEVLIERIQKRAAAGRSDDNAETLKHRLEVFLEQTAPVVDFYAALVKDGKGSFKFVQIERLGSIEEVYAEIIERAFAGRADG